MATKYFFGNQERSIPGVYGQIKSGISNPALNLAFGNLLVIDTNSGAQFGGGSGIAGTLKSGKDSHYTFNNFRDFRKFVGGGVWWLLAAPLFSPAAGINGISSITYIRAAATTPGSATYTWTGGGANGGSVTIQTRTEGLAANGFESDSTQATVTITITAAGASEDTVAISDGTISLGLYTSTGGTVNQAAAALAADINSKTRIHGYSAVYNGTADNFELVAPRWSATTTSTITPVVSGTATATGGAFAGGAAGTIHVGGYAIKMVTGVDSSKFALEFYRGEYRGDDSYITTGQLSGESYDNVALSEAGNTLLTKSADFSNIAELITWMGANSTFNQYFKLSASSVAGTGAVNTADLTASAGNELFTGGTEVFNTTHLNTVLDSITDLNFDFILADKWGEEATATENLSILSYIGTEAKVKPDLYIGGGLDANAWSAAGGSIPTAQTLNSQYVTVVHSGNGQPVSRGEGFKEYASIHTAAAVLGREAGLPPQVPLLFKNITTGKMLHSLVDTDVKLGLNAGVLMVRRDGSSFEVVKGINTAQKNDFLVNDDGSTHSKQLRRIARQIDKELSLNIKSNFLKQAQGPNRNTASPEDVQQYVRKYLQDKEATNTADNLITEFRNVTVSVQGDAYFIEYEIVPNFEVSFVFTTGFLIDPQS